jgi:hypothetical protein
MFAWRKPRPSDDEPLVPHGLIWQATEEPMPAKEETIDPGPLQEPNPPIPVPLRRVDPPPDNYAVDHQIRGDDTPPKMGAVSEPLPWASMNAKDAVKRPPPFWDQNAALKTPVPVPAPGTGDSKSAKLFTAKPNLAAVPTRNAGFNRPTTRDVVLKQFLVERKQELRAAWSEFTHAAAELFANARHAYAGWEFRKNLRQTRERAQARLAITVAKKSARATTPENNTPSKMQARLPVARNAAVRIRNKATASFTDSARSVRRLMHRQVRIRITAGSQLRSFVGRFQRAQQKSRSMLLKNSRLSTSLAMATLSALLTLGLILMVGRYQPSANAGTPTVTSTQSKNTAGIPANTVKAKPSPASGVHSAAATNGSPVVNTALRTPANAARAKTTARRPRHNEDEDYVAPDTYVYYGNKR